MLSWHDELYRGLAGGRRYVIRYDQGPQPGYAGLAFDEAAMREAANRVFDHGLSHLTSTHEFDLGEPWRHRLGEIAKPTLVIHGADDPLFPLAHARALSAEIPGAELLVLERMGHEYFARLTWDVVVPAILRHTER